MTRIAIYPGSFDPVTNGHLDIIHRGRLLFDHLIVAVTNNASKSLFFSVEERVAFLKSSLGRQPGITVGSFSGLLADYTREQKACAIIRGLRAVSDFDYEFQMALMNRRLNRSFETVFLTPDEKFTYLSSSLIREISRLGGDVRGLVPKTVESALRRRTRLSRDKH